MAFSSGFFDSVNGDRKYDASQFGEMLDGLINDGIFRDVGDAFSVVPGTGQTIYVNSGRAWFNHTWNLNTSAYPLSLSYSDMLLPRIDSVVLEIDSRAYSRQNSLKIITGNPSSNPERPSLTNSDGLYQYPLAYIRVPANSNSVSETNITSARGSTETPWVTAKLEIISITNAFAQFEGQFEEWFSNLSYLADEETLISLKFKLDEMSVALANSEAKVATLTAELADIKSHL